MELRRRAAALGVLAIVGCQPAAAESPVPAPSPRPPISFAVAGDAPVIDPADYGAAYLLPGATVVHDGTVHLYAVAFVADPSARPRVLHLVSDDGVAWSGDPDASVLDDFGIELDDIGPVPSSAFVIDDGTWAMVGGGRLPGGQRSIVWRATAPGPNGPWTAHPVPILEPARSGWDTAVVDHPSVVAGAEGEIMAYGGAGRTAPSRSRIGLATSEDGVTWTRVDTTMVGADDAHALGPDACGIDARTMVEPHLLATDGGEMLVFGVMREGRDTGMEIVSATTSDGRTWSCASGAETLGSDDIPGGRQIHSFAVIDHPDGPALLLEVLDEDRSMLWLARGAVASSPAASAIRGALVPGLPAIRSPFVTAGDHERPPSVRLPGRPSQARCIPASAWPILPATDHRPRTSDAQASRAASIGSSATIESTVIESSTSC